MHAFHQGYKFITKILGNKCLKPQYKIPRPKFKFPDPTQQENILYVLRQRPVSVWSLSVWGNSGFWMHQRSPPDIALHRHQGQRTFLISPFLPDGFCFFFPVTHVSCPLYGLTPLQPAIQHQLNSQQLFALNFPVEVEGNEKSEKLK